MKGSWRREAREGFTLIELLVVVSVMLVLMGLLTAAAGGVRRAAQREASMVTVQQLVTALNSYQNDWRSYPEINPQRIVNLAPNTDMNNLYWVGGTWTPEGRNVAMIFQLLAPRAKGPYVDLNSKFLRRPKDSTGALKTITVDGVELRVAVDAYDTPVFVAWEGMLRQMNSSMVYKGYFTEEQGTSNYQVTTKDGTLTVARSNIVDDEVTGMRLWSAGPDRKLDTGNPGDKHDDLDPVIAGR